MLFRNVFGVSLQKSGLVMGTMCNVWECSGLWNGDWLGLWQAGPKANSTARIWWPRTTEPVPTATYSETNRGDSFEVCYMQILPSAVKCHLIKWEALFLLRNVKFRWYVFRFLKTDARVLKFSLSHGTQILSRGKQKINNNKLPNLGST